MVDPKIGALHYEIGAKMGGLQTGLASSLSSIKGFAAAAAATLTGMGIAEGVKTSVIAASDLNETLSKVQTKFGDASKFIIESARDMYKKYGTDQNMFINSATSFGSFFKDLAGNTKEAKEAGAAYGVQLAKLALDMTSMDNTPLETSMTRIKAALVGEFQPIRDSGVIMDAAKIQSYALAAGYKKVGDSVTDQGKLMTVYNQIMKQTTDQQGDLARTKNSFSNQLRELQGRFTGLAVTIGNKVLPPLTDLLIAINEKMPNFEGKISKWIDLFMELGEVFANLGTITANVLLTPLQGVFSTINQKLPDIDATIESWTKALKTFNKVLKDVLADGKHWADQFRDAMTAAGYAISGMFDRLVGGEGNDKKIQELIDRMSGREAAKALKDWLDLSKKNRAEGEDPGVDPNKLDPAKPNQIVGTLKLEITKGASELAKKIQDAIFDPSGAAAQQIAIAKDQAKMLKEANTTLKKIADKPTSGAVAQ